MNTRNKILIVAAILALMVILSFTPLNVNFQRSLDSELQAEHLALQEDYTALQIKHIDLLTRQIELVKHLNANHKGE